MRWIGLVLLLFLTLAAPALGEVEQITYRDYGGRLTVQADTERIDLGKMKVENFDAFESFLNALPNLRYVDMYTTHMFNKRAARLSERYPQIEFGWTLYIGDHTVRTDQTAFSTLHDSIVRRHTSQEMEALRYCRSLRALDLGHNDLTDISFLEELGELRILILADNRIEDLAPLAGLTHLEYIELFNNHVVNLAPLAGLRNLMDLSIAQNCVESLVPLEEMTGLGRLWMYACADSAYSGFSEDLRALRTALAETQIDTDSPGTEGGWRAHPHYDVLFHVFKGKTYFPFEDSTPDGEIQ